MAGDGSTDSRRFRHAVVATLIAVGVASTGTLPGQVPAQVPGQVPAQEAGPAERLAEGPATEQPDEAHGAEPPPPIHVDGEPEPLSKELAAWLEETDALITRAERAAFLSLPRNYQRTAFIRHFWRERDPFPRTTRNELKERWPVRVAEARSRFSDLEEDRARVLLLHDRPSGTLSVRCTSTRIPAEVWFYQESDLVDFPFALVFVQPAEGQPLRIWNPIVGAAGAAVFQRSRACINGSRLAQVVGVLAADPDNYALTLERVLAKPRPRSEEWIDAFVAYSTELPAEATRLVGETRVQFLGRYQQRTVLQGLITVPADQVAVSEYAGFRSRDLRLVGEVLRDEQLFDSFRYSFGFPIPDAEPGETIDATEDKVPIGIARDAASQAGTLLPLAFERYLRPGSYRLVLRLDDLTGGGVYRTELTIEVPQMTQAFVPREQQDPLTATLFAEAIEAIASGETALAIHRPQVPLLTGFTRFDVLASGDEIAKVRFLLDDKPVVTKNRPPWNVGVDLGPHPDLHILRAEGLDADGNEVAADEILINGGGSRFAIKLIEPRRGKHYENSLRVRLAVEVPEGRDLDRVEIFLDERRVATLYQEPFVHPVPLPAGLPVTFVRAVGYLPDGHATEDLVFLGSSEMSESVDVQLVELYTTVLDQDGRSVEGLVQDDFAVFEDGARQSIRRFETVADLPIHVGVLIDNSASMHDVLSDVRKAALSFFQRAITPRDRAAVITFNSFPNLAVELTNNRSALGSGLAGLVAEGRTALYDSLMFGLYYFTGIRGQRALLVLSDGKDESSRFDFEATLEYARRAGITVYTIGLRLNDSGARRKLTRLADETGGRSFFLHTIDSLEEAYATIERELRSQYLIAYQSSNTLDDQAFRTVTLEVERPHVSVKTLSGYYP